MRETVQLGWCPNGCKIHQESAAGQRIERCRCGGFSFWEWILFVRVELFSRRRGGWVRVESEDAVAGEPWRWSVPVRVQNAPPNARQLAASTKHSRGLRRGKKGNNEVTSNQKKSFTNLLPKTVKNCQKSSSPLRCFSILISFFRTLQPCTRN